MNYQLENRIKKLEEQSMECKVCAEKQVAITRILKAYNKEKRILYIALAVQMALVIVLASLGKEGIKAILDAVLAKLQ